MSGRFWAAIVSGLAGAGIVAFFAVKQWGARPLLLTAGTVLLVAAAVAALAPNVGQISSYLGSVGLALATIAAPIVALALFRVSLRSWIAIYVAGAVGGFVLELTTSRGQVELPGPAKPPTDEAEDPRRPLIAQIDLGVCARMLLGGLAAVVALMLFAAAGKEPTATALKDMAEADLSLAYAVAIGAASTAVWVTIQKVAEQRIAGLITSVGAAAGIVDDTLDTATAAQTAIETAAGSEAQKAIESPLRNVVVDALNTDPTVVNLDIATTEFLQRAIEAHPRTAGNSITQLREMSEVVGSLKAAKRHLETLAGKQTEPPGP